MQRLGKLLHDRNAVLVVRCEQDFKPALDTDVFDSSLDRVGKVVDVIGSVEQPYAVVEKKQKVQTGEKLYLRE
ncbi:MAG: Gar1/Naf1 family protein [Halobacteria archaeon]|nr:Gar1/Naf1 family protein [Halobacteria archaeon]